MDSFMKVHMCACNDVLSIWLATITDGLHVGCI